MGLFHRGDTWIDETHAVVFHLMDLPDSFQYPRLDVGLVTVERFANLDDAARGVLGSRRVPPSARYLTFRLSYGALYLSFQQEITQETFDSGRHFRLSVDQAKGLLNEEVLLQERGSSSQPT